jgi:hypothetical protein
MNLRSSSHKTECLPLVEVIKLLTSAIFLLEQEGKHIAAAHVQLALDSCVDPIDSTGLD